MRQMPNLRYTARARPHNWQRRLIRIRSRGSILTLSGVRRQASSFFSCLRYLTFCASVVIGCFHTRGVVSALSFSYAVPAIPPSAAGRENATPGSPGGSRAQLLLKLLPKSQRPPWVFLNVQFFVIIPE